MSLVIGLVVVITANYWQLVRRFPKGGGAAAGAVIALFPGPAPVRIPLALLLLLVAAGLTWFGHGGRLLFAVMTVLFVAASVAVLILGFTSPHTTGHAAASHAPGHSAMPAVVPAFPVAMALATGIEAPRRQSPSWGSSTTPNGVASAGAPSRCCW